MKELITIQKTEVMDVFTKSEIIQPILDKIAHVARSEVFDATTAKGRKDIASMAYRIAQSKTYIENHGKDLAAELKLLPKLVDSNRKLARDFLDSLKDEIRKPLDEWEAEQEAIKLKAEIEAAHEQALLDNIEWAQKKQAEAERIAREKAEYEAKVLADAEIKAKLAADEKARQEIIQAEARALAAENEAKRIAEQSARDLAMAEMKASLKIDEESKRLQAEHEAQKRKAEEEQQRIKAEKSKTEHITKIHDSIVFDLMMNADINENEAKRVLDAIKSGKVDSLRIEY